MTAKLLSAWTPSSGYVYYPPYVNFTYHPEEGVVEVLGRTDEKSGSKGFSVRVPLDVWRGMLAESLEQLK